MIGYTHHSVFPKMKTLFFTAIAFATLSSSILTVAEAAPAKMSAKSTKGKKKSSAGISPDEAKKQLKAMGIQQAKYDKVLQSAITTDADFKTFRLVVAAGADITTPRIWDKLEELTKPGNSPQAKAALQKELTPLQVALLLSNERAARLLLKNPNISTADWSPLEQAICAGKAKEVTALLDEGANPFARGNSGTLPLCLAAILGKKACVEAILKQPKSKEQAEKAINQRNELLSRLEIQAAYIASTPHGSNEHNHGSYITDSFYNGSISEFTLSLMYPEHVWVAPSPANEQITTWRRAFNQISGGRFHDFQGRTKLKILMKTAKPDLPEAYIAVLNQDMQALSKSLAKVDKKTLDGERFSLEPILFYAIKVGNINILKALLKAGISPNQETQIVTNGVIENMLLIAAQNNQPEMLLELIRAGADINAAVDHGSKFLDKAISHISIYSDADVWYNCVNYILPLPEITDESASPLNMAVLRKNHAKIQEFVDAASKKEGTHAHNDRCDIADAIGYCIFSNDIKAIQIMAPVLFGSNQQKRIIERAKKLNRDDIVKILQGDS